MARLTGAVRFAAVLMRIGLMHAAASLAQEAAVNPLTGTPLSLEQAHWALEQAKLDEQLQASLLNRRRFELERQRLDAGVPVNGVPVNAGADAGLAAAAPLHPFQDAAPEPRRAAEARLEPGSARRLRSHPPAHLQPTAQPPWPVLGVRTQGANWCLLVAEGGNLRPLCAGASRAGHHLDAVGAERYTIDGVVYRLETADTRIVRPGGGAGGAGTEPVAFSGSGSPMAEPASGDAAPLSGPAQPGLPSAPVIAAPSDLSLPFARAAPALRAPLEPGH